MTTNNIDSGQQARSARNATTPSVTGRAAAAREACPSLPMQQPEWIQSSLDVFGVQGRIYRLWAPEGPAVFVRPTGSVAYSLPGAAELAEPSDVPLVGWHARLRLAQRLAREHVPLRLQRVLAASPTAMALKEGYSGRGVVVCAPAPGYPWLDFERVQGRWQGLLSRSLEHDLRRAWRRARALGPVSIDMYGADSASSMPALLQQAWMVEHASWKGRAGTALLQDTLRRRFFEAYARRLWARGALRLGLLRLNGHAIAMQLAVELGERLWLLKIGYDERFRACSPGQLLMAEVIEDAVKRGLRSLEFLGTPAAWTRRWTRQERPCLDVRAYPYAVRGVFAVGQQMLGRRFGSNNTLSLAQPRVRAHLGGAAQALMRSSIRAYSAGPALHDALGVSKTLRQRGFGCTLGYFERSGESPELVAERYETMLDALARGPQCDYASLKVSGIGSRWDLVQRLLTRAGERGVGLHFDALGIEQMDVIVAFMLRHWAPDGPSLSFTLPSRWRRSLEDARLVNELGVAVRLVKGQWPDPRDPERDARRGFMQLVRAVQHARCVRIATHDAPLARAALMTLRECGTRCEVELLYGLPAAAPLAVARELGVPVRIYIPYGARWLPYAVGDAVRDPTVTWWLARDLLASGFGVARRTRIPDAFDVGPE